MMEEIQIKKTTDAADSKRALEYETAGSYGRKEIIEQLQERIDDLTTCGNCDPNCSATIGIKQRCGV